MKKRDSLSTRRKKRERMRDITSAIVIILAAIPIGCGGVYCGRGGDRWPVIINYKESKSL